MQSCAHGIVWQPYRRYPRLAGWAARCVIIRIWTTEWKSTPNFSITKSAARTVTKAGSLKAWRPTRERVDLRSRLTRYSASLDPTLVSAWFNLGLLHRDLVAVEESRRAFREFLATADSDYDAEVRMVRGWTNEGSDSPQ